MARHGHSKERTQQTFVVARKTGASYSAYWNPDGSSLDGIDYATFSSLDEATEVYEDMAYIVRNAPEELDQNCSIIVRSVAMFCVYTDNMKLAVKMVIDHHAILFESEGWDEEATNG